MGVRHLRVLSSRADQGDRFSSRWRLSASIGRGKARIEDLIYRVNYLEYVYESETIHKKSNKVLVHLLHAESVGREEWVL